MKESTVATESFARPDGKSTASLTIASKTLPISEEQIRVRAYEIFLARAGRPGDAAADWMKAEDELREMALSVTEKGAAAMRDPGGLGPDKRTEHAMAGAAGAKNEHSGNDPIQGGNGGKRKPPRRRS